MKYLKQYIICAAAALVCLAALAGCSARNSSDSKLILDGNKFRIGQCTIREITAAGFDLKRTRTRIRTFQRAPCWPILFYC